MLVLSRKRGERIVIAENIELTILDIYGDRIRIGIEAPPDIPVHREEVFERIQNSGVAKRPVARFPDAVVDVVALA
jgi:carbon storage regulator